MVALLIRFNMWNYLDRTAVKAELIANNQESKTTMDKCTNEDSKAKSEIILSISQPEIKKIKGCANVLLRVIFVLN